MYENGIDYCMYECTYHYIHSKGSGDKLVFFIIRWSLVIYIHIFKFELF